MRFPRFFNILGIATIGVVIAAVPASAGGTGGNVGTPVGITTGTDVYTNYPPEGNNAYGTIFVDSYTGELYVNNADANGQPLTGYVTTTVTKSYRGFITITETFKSGGDHLWSQLNYETKTTQTATTGRVQHFFGGTVQVIFTIPIGVSLTYAGASEHFASLPAPSPAG